MLGAKPLLFLLAVAGLGGIGAAETVEKRIRFGSMTLIQEQWTRDPGEPPIMHVADAWTKLHLRWSAPAGDMAVALTDDGRVLTITVEGYDCLRSSSHYRYSRRTGEPALWGQMAEHLRAFVQTCPRVPAVRAAAYPRAFAEAHDDFVAGIEAFKKRAVTAVAADLKRCRPRPPEGKLVIEPFADRCGKME